MNKSLLTLALAAGFSAPTLAAPVWPDLVVQLHGSGHAYIVDTRTDAVVADLETCKGGGLGTTTPDAKKVYVSCAGEGQKELIAIDLAGRKVIKRIETGNRPKHGVVSPDGKWVGLNHWAWTAANCATPSSARPTTASPRSLTWMSQVPPRA